MRFALEASIAPSIISQSLFSQRSRVMHRATSGFILFVFCGATTGGFRYRQASKLASLARSERGWFRAAGRSADELGHEDQHPVEGRSSRQGELHADCLGRSHLRYDGGEDGPNRQGIGNAEARSSLRREDGSAAKLLQVPGALPGSQHGQGVVGKARGREGAARGHA